MFDRVGQRVSRIVQNCVVEAEVRPQILVKSLQIIERQELADAKVSSVPYSSCATTPACVYVHARARGGGGTGGTAGGGRCETPCSHLLSPGGGTRVLQM